MKTHIVFNAQLFADLSELLPEDNHLLFPYKLSTGDVLDLESRNTKKIEEKIYHIAEDLLTDSYNKLNRIKSSRDPVVVWFSQETNDYCNFLFLLDFLPTCPGKINCSQKISFNEGHVMHESSNSLSFEEVQYLLDFQEEVTQKEKHFLLESQWRKNKNAEQRIFKKDTLLRLDLNFLDSLISQSRNNGYTSKAEIVFSIREILELDFPEQVIMSRLKFNT
jgi:hypothetical protein